MNGFCPGFYYILFILHSFGIKLIDYARYACTVIFVYLLKPERAVMSAFEGFKTNLLQNT